MSEKYIPAELEIIGFQTEDVITASKPIIDPETGLPIIG